MTKFAKFGASFFFNKSFVQFNDDKKGLGYTSGDFFINASGHPVWGGSGVLDEKILESTLVQNWHWMSSPATVVSSFPRPSPQTDISSQTPLSRVVRRLKVKVSI
jgi:hypothetical protein